MPDTMSRISDPATLHAGLGALQHVSGVHFNSGGTFYVRLRGEATGQDVVVNSGDDFDWPVVQISASGGGSAITTGDAFVKV